MHIKLDKLSIMGIITTYSPKKLIWNRIIILKTRYKILAWNTYISQHVYSVLIFSDADANGGDVLWIGISWNTQHSSSDSKTFFGK